MTEACERAGCAGHYAADGYCDECGHKRPATRSAQPSRGQGAAAAAGLRTAAAGPRTAAAGSGKAGSGAATVRPRSGATAAVDLGISTAATRGRGGMTAAAHPSGSVVSGRSRAGGRGRLGANLVSVPPVPPRDPTTAVLRDPQLPESQRFCASCGAAVGRGRKGRPGRTEGFCPKDRTPFSFVPHLSPGELVDDRYEILGALAHGGLGWIYLARDRNISDSGADRWVVLKGLINTGDADAMAAAVAERRFLVEVDHPSIVKVYDFARHPDPKSGELVGYIVMEYVGGRSLKDLALGNTGPDGRRAPLPLDQVLAYGIEILPALGYLHDRGLLFCDFKPDNVIHAEEQLKLIDLGAVRSIDDQTSPLWGTPGYQAPELERRGASVASDIYTVGRTLAVLSFDFGGFSTRYAASLPDPSEVELFAREESYHRLLRRATDPEPSRRFASAGELADQALGVLREVLSAADGVARPAPSTHFTPERRVFGAGTGGLDGAAVATALPVPLVDPTDPAAGFLATLGGDAAAATIATLEAAPLSSVEVGLRLVRALIEAGRPEDAATALTAAAPAPGDWRLDWYAGLIALAAGRFADAVDAFNAVYSGLPGEPAARLALAVACELAGDGDGAIRRYARVWRVDHAMVSAAFGLARTLVAAGDRANAVAILDEVPEVSSQYLAAQVAAVRATVDSTSGPLTEADLVAASARLERLRLDTAHRTTLVVEMLRTALGWLTPASADAGPAGAGPAGKGTAAQGTAAQGTGAPDAVAKGAVAPAAPGAAGSAGAAVAGSGGAPSPVTGSAVAVEAGGPPRRPWLEVVRTYLATRTQGAAATTPVAPARFLGEALREHELRLGLERAYRTLASLETDPAARYRLVDLANAVRPQTVV